MGNYNILEGKTAVSNSYIGMFPPSNILVHSDDPSIRWISNTVPCDIDIDLGDIYYVDSFDVTFMSHFNSEPAINGWTSPNYDLISYEIQGRLNNGDWFTLQTYNLNDTNETAPNSSSEAVNQLRLHVTKGLKVNPSVASIVEFKAYGRPCNFLSKLLCNGSSAHFYPPFSPRTLGYVYIAQEDEKEVVFTPSVKESDIATSIIEVDVAKVASGENSKPIKISENAGTRELPIRVYTTDEHGTINYNHFIIYPIIILRSTQAQLKRLRFSPPIKLDPEFASNKYDYTATTDQTYIQIIPIAEDSNAKIKVNGISVKSGEPIKVDLKSGENIVKVTVTAELGPLTYTYTLKINCTATPQVEDN